AISDLGVIPGNYDLGVVLGSYFGLLFLIAAYASIGLFASTLSENQIVAFIIGILLCFLLFNGFDAVSTLFSNGDTQLQIQQLGARAHFESIARGIIDTRDLIYFISISFFFLYLTHARLSRLTQ
ncbi:MAG: gliding motility-associated ABC transporter permease subunit GldF, partial [Bacteroidota bacterium]